MFLQRSIELQALHVLYRVYLVIFVLSYAMSRRGFSGKGPASDIRRPLLYDIP